MLHDLHVRYMTRTQLLMAGGLALAESGKYMLQLNKEQVQAFTGRCQVNTKISIHLY